MDTLLQRASGGQVALLPHTDSLTFSLSLSLSLSDTHTHTHTHKHTHKHAHTHTHTHTRTISISHSLSHTNTHTHTNTHGMTLVMIDEMDALLQRWSGGQVALLSLAFAPLISVSLSHSLPHTHTHTHTYTHTHIPGFLKTGPVFSWISSDSRSQGPRCQANMFPAERSPSPP